MNDREMAKRAVEEIVLAQLIDSFPLITGRKVTEAWDGDANRVEGSPDFIIELDGQPLGIELTEIRGATDSEDYIAEGYRLAARKSESYARRNIFRFPIALIMHSNQPSLFEIHRSLSAVWQDDFEELGFEEIWAVDFSDAFYSSGHPFRRADMFCFKPKEWFGFHRIGDDRKPYG